MSQEQLFQPIEDMQTYAFQIPTETPESDGTFEWNHTTMVLVQVSGGGETGCGYTYAHSSVAKLIDEYLKPIVLESDAIRVVATWDQMVNKVRNLGRPGLCAMAIAAVDMALWDLKAHLLKLPLTTLLGQVYDAVPVYGSGGFTSYSLSHLQKHTEFWLEKGFTKIKMKVGRRPDEDLKRIKAVREVIGPERELFVDANGAYHIKQALSFAKHFSKEQISWFEEPVSSDDLNGLNYLVHHAPAGMEIAAGEYGYDSYYFLKVLQAEAVDVLQADITRCGGVTGFLKVENLCDAFHRSLSAHTAPTAHLHVCASLRSVRHIECFYDHVRIEKMFFDGYREAKEGWLSPDLTRNGMGIVLKNSDAKRFQIYGKDL